MASLRMQWFHFREGCSLYLEVCLQIHLRSLYVFMTKPERNDGAIHATLEQFHCCGVAPDVRTNAFSSETWT